MELINTSNMYNINFYCFLYAIKISKTETPGKTMPSDWA